MAGEVDELAQRRREQESRAWDDVNESAADMLGICPECGAISHIGGCESCGKMMCADCFGAHEQHPCRQEGERHGG